MRELHANSNSERTRVSHDGRYLPQDKAAAHVERDGEGNEQALAKLKAAMLKVGELGCVRCQEARERLRSFGDRSRADVSGVEALLEIWRRFRGIEAGLGEALSTAVELWTKLTAIASGVYLSCDTFV